MPDPQRGKVWLADLGLAAKVLGTLSAAQLTSVEKALRLWLGL